MARRSDRFSSGYLKAEDDMTIKGEKSMILTISKVTEEESAFRKGETQPVANFEEIEEKLGLNATNWDMIAMISGEPDDQDWGGTIIELHVERVRNPQGKHVPGIRVGHPPSNGKKPAASSSSGATFGADSGATLVAFLSENGRSVADMRHALVTAHRVDPDSVRGDPASWPESVRPNCRKVSRWFLDNPGDTPPWGATPHTFDGNDDDLPI